MIKKITINNIKDLQDLILEFEASNCSLLFVADRGTGYSYAYKHGECQLSQDSYYPNLPLKAVLDNQLFRDLIMQRKVFTNLSSINIAEVRALFNCPVLCDIAPIALLTPHGHTFALSDSTVMALEISKQDPIDRSPLIPEQLVVNQSVNSILGIYAKIDNGISKDVRVGRLHPNLPDIAATQYRQSDDDQSIKIVRNAFFILGAVLSLFSLAVSGICFVVIKKQDNADDAHEKSVTCITALCAFLFAGLMSCCAGCVVSGKQNQNAGTSRNVYGRLFAAFRRNENELSEVVISEMPLEPVISKPQEQHSVLSKQ